MPVSLRLQFCSPTTHPVAHCGWHAERLCIFHLVTVLWPRRLVAGLSLWRSGFDRTLFPVRFNMALGQTLLRVFRFTLVTIIPPLLHTHLHLHAILSEREENWLEKYFCLF